MCVCLVVCMCDIFMQYPKGQKSVSDPLELESQVVVSHYVDASEPVSPVRGAVLAAGPLLHSTDRLSQWDLGPVDWIRLTGE